MTKRKPRTQPKADAPLLHPMELVPLAKIKPYDRNARLHSEEQLAALEKSISAHGFTNPIQIDEAGVIIGGHGRFIVATRLGMKAVPCIRITGLSPEKVRALRLADNQLGLRSTWDEQLKMVELADLHRLNVNLETTGFELTELADLRLLPGLTLLDDGKGGKKKGGASRLRNDFVFRVVIDCKSGEQQAELLERFEKEGLSARPLVS